MDWADYWQEALDKTKERSPEFDPEDYYRSGRASKAWPDKETPEWWAENGPKFVQQWQTWRDNCGLKLWEWPDDNGELHPGIEVEAEATSGDLLVKCFIDRVMEDEHGNLYIIDLKSGTHTDPWPLQMALNALCLEHTYGMKAQYAGFWKARKGGIVGTSPGQWFDLSIYTHDFLWDLVGKAKQIRDQQLFMPHPNNLCASACGVARYCRAMGGDPSFFEQRATMTHNEEGSSE